jgi:hypothetical protein
MELQKFYHKEQANYEITIKERCQESINNMIKALPYNAAGMALLSKISRQTNMIQTNWEKREVKEEIKKVI